ncbi:phage holin family protein [uncultured Campylobacter sp.]|mgnify:FL=1|uniref:phage holin family protein n=1 Tax=uncultured Campylobacter sp. TaxID=218934 RepID=UPI00261ED37E|nr:phage holin family protein [uncultured Campylobacter sp.]
MNDLNSLFDKIYWGCMMALAIAITALRTMSKKRKSKFAYIVAFLSGFLSSITLCYFGSEFTLFMTGNTRFGLAVGGFFAWVGADAVKNWAEKFVCSKLGIDRRMGEDDFREDEYEDKDK